MGRSPHALRMIHHPFYFAWFSDSNRKAQNPAALHSIAHIGFAGVFLKASLLRAFPLSRSVFGLSSTPLFCTTMEFSSVPTGFPPASRVYHPFVSGLLLTLFTRTPCTHFMDILEGGGVSRGHRLYPICGFPPLSIRYVPLPPFRWQQRSAVSHRALEPKPQPPSGGGQTCLGATEQMPSFSTHRRPLLFVVLDYGEGCWI